MLEKNIDISLISKTKVECPLTQFKIEGFTTPHRYDRNDKGVGLLLHIREDIPSRLLQSKSHCNIESLPSRLISKKESGF